MFTPEAVPKGPQLNNAQKSAKHCGTHNITYILMRTLRQEQEKSQTS